MKIDGKKNRSLNVLVTCVAILTIVGVGFALSKAATVAIPFLLAILLSMLCFPLMKWGARKRVPTFVMVAAVMASLAAVLLPLGILLNSRVQGMSRILPGYYAKLVEIGRTLLTHFGLARGFWETIDWYNTIGRYVSGMTEFMLDGLGTMVMMLIFLVFMLLESKTAENRLRLAFRGENGHKMTVIAGKIVAQISKYLRTLAVISFATGCCVCAALTLIGVDFALTWGALAFFLNFIPTIGSIVASIPPILVALVQFYPNWVPAILTFLALLSIQFIIGNIMTPKIMGDALDLSPVVILISLMYWGMIWGISGALLSVPIAVMIKIICENVPSLHFVAMMMCSAKEERYAALLDD